MTTTSYPAAPAEATAIGRVVAVNDKGIRFEGAEQWSNISKYAVGIVLPQKGETVRVTFDRQGWIRSICAEDGGATPQISTSSTSPLGAAPATAQPAPRSADTDRRITRLAVLKAAAEFGSSRPDLKSGDVLKIAESWERWVLREPGDDLEEAL